MCFWKWVWMSALCIVATALPAAAVTVDQEYIHRMYNDGEFRAVLDSLEPIMARPQKFAHEDSVFIAKHLAVIYSADPAQREKGRYYMYRLLELVPSAKLLDMYASEEINRIFDNTKEEYSARKLAATGAPVTASKNDSSAHLTATIAPAPPRNSPTVAATPVKEAPVSARSTPPVARSAAPESAQHSSSKAWLWAGAGLAVVAVGGAALYVLETPSSGAVATPLQVDARTP